MLVTCSYKLPLRDVVRLKIRGCRKVKSGRKLLKAQETNLATTALGTAQVARQVIWTASNIANKKKTTLRCYWVYREPGHSEKKRKMATSIVPLVGGSDARDGRGAQLIFLLLSEATHLRSSIPRPPQFLFGFGEKRKCLPTSNSMAQGGIK